ncbi:purine-nucleoside phosphorylase [Candidatus Sumerlaeota bacterium]|nr:purine-nucleoside phosphorylase [Candidatus Sumerlaeota bacterium]
MSGKAAEIAERIAPVLREKPLAAIVSGSGQSRLGRRLGLKPIAAMSALPHFHRPTVAGHSGEIMAGRISGAPAMLFAGRCHFYEAPEPEQVSLAVRVCAALGVPRVILLNSAGGLNAAFEPGELMLITDSVNLQFRTPPLSQPQGHERAGLNLCDMFSLELIHIAREQALQAKIRLHEGTYVAMPGPAYETRADIEMLRMASGDAVGMSTLPEAYAAHDAGLQTLAISVITNSCVRPAAETTHAEVLQNAAHAEDNLARLLRAILKKLAQ